MKSEPTDLSGNGECIAAIDVGSNTFLLLIARSDGRRVEKLATDHVVVRLGEGVDKTGVLSEAAMRRAMQALERYAGKIQAAGCRQVVACGTSALRDASNAETFLARVREKFGIEIRIIDGAQEARYSFYGALSDITPHNPAPVLVIDIGGGSTELALGDHEELRQRISLNVGTVRLTERYVRHDPVTPGEVTAMQQEIRDHLATVSFLRSGRPGTIIEVDGTGTILTMMKLRMAEYRSSRVHHQVLRLHQIEEIIAQLIPLTVAERGEIVGLPVERADVILAGALILSEILRATARDSLLVSTRGLRYGLALSAARHDSDSKI